MIPSGLAERQQKGPLIQYGHGMFADQSEIYDPVRQLEAFNFGW